VRKFFLSAFAVCVVFGVFLTAAFAQKSQNSTNSSSSSSSSDRAFLDKAIEDNAAEVELGKMAESKSQNPKVQQFASMMVKDHTDALNRLRGAATSGSDAGNTGNQNTTSGQGTQATQLSSQHQQLRDRLSKLSGNEFDRAYMTAMVQEHQKDIREFEREAGSQGGGNSSTSSREKPAPVGTENDPKALARDLLPTLRMHLQMAQSVQQQLGK